MEETEDVDMRRGSLIWLTVGELVGVRFGVGGYE